MKKVRLFAVAAAMGMFASTVTAAETTTGYVTTWGEVDEIIKVDVGDKVVAPTATVRVVKETRTTDTAEAGSKDEFGFDLDAVCYTSTGTADDIDEDGYSDVQVYFNRNVDGGIFNDYYTDKLEAVKEYLLDNQLVFAPNSDEVDVDDVDEYSYYSVYSNETFADFEAVYAYFLEKGLIEEVYDEHDDLINVYINATEITDKNGNVKAYTRLNYTVTGDEEDAKLEIVTKLIAGTDVGTPEKLLTYPNKKTAENKLGFAGVWDHDNDGTATKNEIKLGSVVIVKEKKGELVIAEVYGPNDILPTTDDYYLAGWKNEDGSTASLKRTSDKVTVYEADKKGASTKLATVSQATAARFTPESTMVWDEEVGTFVKEVADYTSIDDDAEVVKGYWYGNVYEAETEDKAEVEELMYKGEDVRLDNPAFGIVTVKDRPENETDKYVLRVNNVEGVNIKEGKITLKTAATTAKEIVVDAVEVGNTWYPVFDSMEELVKIASKLAEFNNEAAVNPGGKTTADNVVDYSGVGGFYESLKALDADPWSGYTLTSELETELRGPGSEACYYVVDETQEEVEATITSNADSVDTSVAGVKTLTLTAKVGEEVVSTKEVKVVVAPKYERTYVNGKVSVLKAFHLNGNLYAEYHYDWAAKTYSATFYQQDGVTVGSTANGTL